MLSRKYKTVVAGILTATALFSPLLYGMTWPEARAQKSSAAVDFAPAAAELAGEFAVTGVVGCVLTHVVLEIDWSDWVGVLEGAAWVWVGFEAVRLVGAISQRGNELVGMVRP